MYLVFSLIGNNSDIVQIGNVLYVKKRLSVALKLNT